MKIAKEINGELDIIEVTTKVQIDTYTKEGYELIAETDKPSDNATCHYDRVTNGWVQVWEDIKTDML